MEEINSPTNNKEIDQEDSKKNFKPSKTQIKNLIIRNKRSILIAITISLLIIFSLSIVSISKSNKSINNTVTPVTTQTPTPTKSPTPTISKIIYSPTPSIININNTTPTPTKSESNNNSQAQSPTPNSSAKPEFSITFPSEGQTVSYDSPDQQLCVVTVPIANTSGTNIFINLNNSGWKQWYCFVPPSGANTVQVKLSGNNKESDVQTRSFNFVKNY